MPVSDFSGIVKTEASLEFIESNDFAGSAPGYGHRGFRPGKGSLKVVTVDPVAYIT
jgi:hypothetical protein